MQDVNHVLCAEGSSKTCTHLQQAGGAAGDVAGVRPASQPELRQEAELRGAHQDVNLQNPLL